MKKYTCATFALCTACMLAATTVSVSAADAPDKLATEGIIAALQQLDKSDKDNKNIKNTGLESAGIALAFDNYYDTELVHSPASVEGIKNILKLAPDEEKTSDETQQKETAQEEQNVQPAQQPASVIEGYTNLGVANVENYLNVREQPSTDAAVLGKLPMNAGCEINETLDGWYKITSGDVSGYVSAEFLLVGEQANQKAAEAKQTVATVMCDRLMVREQANTECTILNRVAMGEDLEVVEVLDGWVHVNLSGTEGYVCADYVNVHDALPKGVTLEQLVQESEEAQADIGAGIVEYAKQFLGNPYVWGGTSLTNGADCSGFTMRIFEHFGYSLSRTSAAQSNNGTRVDLSDIQPGDLLFYSYGGSIGHVAIYAGGGRIIHASTEKTGICVGNAYFMTPTCAVRIAG